MGNEFTTKKETYNISIMKNKEKSIWLQDNYNKIVGNQEFILNEGTEDQQIVKMSDFVPKSPKILTNGELNTIDIELDNDTIKLLTNEIMRRYIISKKTLASNTHAFYITERPVLKPQEKGKYLNRLPMTMSEGYEILSIESKTNQLSLDKKSIFEWMQMHDYTLFDENRVLPTIQDIFNHNFYNKIYISLVYNWFLNHDFDGDKPVFIPNKVHKDMALDRTKTFFKNHNFIEKIEKIINWWKQGYNNANYRIQEEEKNKEQLFEYNVLSGICAYAKIVLPLNGKSIQDKYIKTIYETIIGGRVDLTFDWTTEMKNAPLSMIKYEVTNHSEVINKLWNLHNFIHFFNQGLSLSTLSKTSFIDDDYFSKLVKDFNEETKVQYLRKLYSPFEIMIKYIQTAIASEKYDLIDAMRHIKYFEGGVFVEKIPTRQEFIAEFNKVSAEIDTKSGFEKFYRTYFLYLTSTHLKSLTNLVENNDNQEINKIFNLNRLFHRLYSHWESAIKNFDFTIFNTKRDDLVKELETLKKYDTKNPNIAKLEAEINDIENKNQIIKTWTANFADMENFTKENELWLSQLKNNNVRFFSDIAAIIDYTPVNSYRILTDYRNNIQFGTYNDVLNALNSVSYGVSYEKLVTFCFYATDDLVASSVPTVKLPFINLNKVNAKIVNAKKMQITPNLIGNGMNWSLAVTKMTTIFNQLESEKLIQIDNQTNEYTNFPRFITPLVAPFQLLFLVMNTTQTGYLDVKTKIKNGIDIKNEWKDSQLEYFGRYIANVLFPVKEDSVYAYFHGYGNDGKTTLLNDIVSAIGINNTYLPDNNSENNQNQFSSQKLVGKKLYIKDDLNDNNVENTESMIKRYTSRNATLDVELKRQNGSLSFPAYMSIIVASNSKSSQFVSDKANFRRIRVFSSFNNVEQKQNHVYQKQLFSINVENNKSNYLLMWSMNTYTDNYAVYDSFSRKNNTVMQSGILLGDTTKSYESKLFANNSPYTSYLINRIYNYVAMRYSPEEKNIKVWRDNDKQKLANSKLILKNGQFYLPIPIYYDFELQAFSDYRSTKTTNSRNSKSSLGLDKFIMHFNETINMPWATDILHLQVIEPQLDLSLFEDGMNAYNKAQAANKVLILLPLDKIGVLREFYDIYNHGTSGELRLLEQWLTGGADTDTRGNELEPIVKIAWNNEKSLYDKWSEKDNGEYHLVDFLKVLNDTEGKAYYLSYFNNTDKVKLSDIIAKQNDNITTNFSYVLPSVEEYYNVDTTVDNNEIVINDIRTIFDFFGLTDKNEYSGRIYTIKITDMSKLFSSDNLFEKPVKVEEQQPVNEKPITETKNHKFDNLIETHKEREDRKIKEEQEAIPDWMKSLM